jgi:KDO2-lipid IV(A) lauroyltransferase
MKSALQKKVEGAIGVWTLKAVLNKVGKMSESKAERTGAKLGRLLMHIGKRRRETAISNIMLAFPEKSRAEAEALTLKVFEHFGIVTTDFLRIPKRKKEDVFGTMEVEGKEYLDAAIAGGKGAILVTAHFGNWERSASWVSLTGYPLNVIARDADDEGVNGILNTMRTYSGTNVIARGDAARPMLERLRKNEFIGILPDQNSDEIYIPFFGKPAGTVLGPGVVSNRTGSPVIPFYCVRVGPNRYKVIIRPPLVAQEGYTVKGEGMMRAIHAEFEQMISQYPEQWLWFHDRWRNARRKGLL